MGTGKRIIYCDMDGVLTDFNAGYKLITGRSPSDVRSDSNRELYAHYWDTFVDAEGFTNLDWQPGGQELVEYLRSIEDRVQICILSSAGGFHRQREVQDQKLDWLHLEGIEWPTVIVPGRRYKPAFATQNALLIDDTKDTVREFALIGRAIHHTDAKHTIPLIDLWLSDVH